MIMSAAGDSCLIVSGSSLQLGACNGQVCAWPLAGLLLVGRLVCGLLANADACSTGCAFGDYRLSPAGAYFQGKCMPDPFASACDNSTCSACRPACPWCQATPHQAPSFRHLPESVLHCLRAMALDGLHVLLAAPRLLCFCRRTVS